jgi:hypothetical protein
MGSTGTKRGIFARFAVIAAAGVLAALVITPAAAFAATKAATKIVVVSQTVVNWSTPGVTPPAPSVSAKLYRKSGAKWVALKGKVTMQMEQGADTNAWGPKTAKTGSAVSFLLASRGRYRLVYAGSATTKPVTAYAKRLDSIGPSITFIGATRSDIDGTWTQVTASYGVTWNVEAFLPENDAMPLEFSFYGTYSDMNFYPDPDAELYSGDVYFYQQMWEPGTVWISYRIRTSDIPPDFATPTTVTKFYYDCTMTSQDPYISIPKDFGVDDYVMPSVDY